MLGLRADSTPQVARIDAHLLNRRGVTRLCYCGPVLHTRPGSPHATREPLQLGAEIYGHAGLEADLEVLSLALDGLSAARAQTLSVDMADARIVRAILQGVSLGAQALAEIHAALAAKDSSALQGLTRALPKATRDGLLTLTQLYGDAKVLLEAQKAFPATPVVQEALSNLQWLAARLGDVQVTFDLADLRGYAYYSGTNFAIFARGAHDALVRGGRYDEVGAVFGRNRPAAGFSLDLKALVSAVSPRPLRAAIRAPWRDAADLRAAIAALRAQGETVVCALPGHESEVDEFHCDRELTAVAGQWVVQSL
jgi:ATP phosphoribosyltransferase regulatory subunit